MPGIFLTANVVNPVLVCGVCAADSTSHSNVCRQRYRVAISLISDLFAFFCFGVNESRSDESWDVKDLITGWNRIDRGNFKLQQRELPFLAPLRSVMVQVC